MNRSWIILASFVACPAQAAAKPDRAGNVIASSELMPLRVGQYLHSANIDAIVKDAVYGRGGIGVAPRGRSGLPIATRAPQATPRNTSRRWKARKCR